jgi:hypothetical protein
MKSLLSMVPLTFPLMNKEMSDIDTPGHLVPRTAAQDHLLINGTILHLII